MNANRIPTDHCVRRRHRQCRRTTPMTARSGFTLVEMIMVIGTIVFLLTALASLTAGVQQQAAQQATKSIINRVEIALFDYFSTHGEYPPATSKDTIDPVDLHEHLVLPEYGGFMTGISPQAIATDPFSDKPVIVDTWKGPIRVVVLTGDSLTINGGQPLVFSTGRDRRGWDNGEAFSGANASKMRGMIVNPTPEENQDNITNFKDIPIF